MSTKEYRIPTVDTHQFRYQLPEESIAKYPLDQRDGSKLLVANPKQLTIKHSNFYRLAEYIPQRSLLVRNDTKVITARLLMKKETGGQVEVLLLEPLDSSAQDEMYKRGTSAWKCLIGGRNVKEGMTLLSHTDEISFEGIVLHKSGAEGIVRFKWSPDTMVLAQVLDILGTTPLPPYMHREANEDDKVRYQTVYALNEGSVAAPTAGLHFTERVFDSLRENYCAFADVTLHVGLGTFKPIDTETLDNFTMHNERFEVSLRTISKIRQSLEERRCIISVGTTSMRTIESLYWIGCRLLREGNKELLLNQVTVSQWEPYSDRTDVPSAIDVFKALEGGLKELNIEQLTGSTEIMIVPGYQSRVFNALITNFHQPESTLMLLVAAFVGDYWKEIYQTALEENYRFLSYGDSSLLFRYY